MKFEQARRGFSIAGIVCRIAAGFGSSGLEYFREGTVKTYKPDIRDLR